MRYGAGLARSVTFLICRSSAANSLFVEEGFFLSGSGEIRSDFRPAEKVSGDSLTSMTELLLARLSPERMKRPMAGLFSASRVSETETAGMLPPLVGLLEPRLPAGTEFPPRP